MSTLAQRISETPMTPYIDVMKSMTVSDMNVVVDFLNEAIRESEEAKRKADDEFLARKMAEINISPETHELFEWLRLTPEEAADERTRYILGER
jgi:hypothetical protein